MRIRPMGEADLGGVRELRSVVRWAADPRAFDLLRGTRDARWAVAEVPGGPVAGMVGAVPLGGIGILCHLAVHEEHRGSGLGTALSRWAVAYLRGQGARMVRLYSTPQAEGLYRALGFRPVCWRTVYRREVGSGLPVTHEPPGYRIGALLMGDLPELYGVDAWAYGGDRSHLIFATLRRHPGLGLVARDRSGRIKGYLLRSRSGRTVRIGPFMAESFRVACALLGAALAGSPGETVEAAVPEPPGSPAHALFRSFGFAGRSERLRMELGCGAREGGGLGQYATTAYLAT
ncbi:MAG: GNAT family N-acetyltransferase [Rubrobacter sp.]|nr:GNAT family N-acetyltransferase [Rubrobacter sp.]